jgi:hypothetical protein
VKQQIEEAAKKIEELAIMLGAKPLCDSIELREKVMKDYLLPIISKHLSSGWVKVTPETMPPFGVDVYLWSIHGWPTVGQLRKFDNDEWYWKNHADFPTECFTHWMIPSPPE